VSYANPALLLAQKQKKEEKNQSGFMIGKMLQSLIKKNMGN